MGTMGCVWPLRRIRILLMTTNIELRSEVETKFVWYRQCVICCTLALVADGLKLFLFGDDRIKKVMYSIVQIYWEK